MLDTSTLFRIAKAKNTDAAERWLDQRTRRLLYKGLLKEIHFGAVMTLSDSEIRGVSREQRWRYWFTRNVNFGGGA